MKDLNKYKIQFANLTLGVHLYEFDVDNKFFEEFECFDYLTAAFNVKVELTRQSVMMILNFEFSGNISVPCDRCLDVVDLVVDGKEKLIVKFGSEEYEDTDDILILSDNEYELNVARYIYEFIQLHIPQKRVHQFGECNPEVIERLEEIEDNKEKEIDPRWSDLNKLK